MVHRISDGAPPEVPDHTPHLDSIEDRLDRIEKSLSAILDSLVPPEPVDEKPAAPEQKPAQ